jgi:hypothetical protein
VLDEYIALYMKYMKDVRDQLLDAKSRRMDLETILEEYTYPERFCYIAESGIEAATLERGHTNNLKYTWYLLNDIDPEEE